MAFGKRASRFTAGVESKEQSAGPASCGLVHIQLQVHGCEPGRASPVSVSSLDFPSILFFFSIFLPICSSNPLYILPLVYTTALITVNDDIRAI